MMFSLCSCLSRQLLIQKELMNIFSKKDIEIAIELLQSLNLQKFQKIIQHEWRYKSSESSSHRFHNQLMKMMASQEQNEKRLKISRQKLEKKYFDYLQKKEKNRGKQKGGQEQELRNTSNNYRNLLYTLNLTNFNEDDEIAKNCAGIYIQEQRKLNQLFKAIHHSVKLGFYQPLENYRQISQLFAADQICILQQFTKLLKAPLLVPQQKKSSTQQLFIAFNQKDLEKYQEKISGQTPQTKKLMLEIWQQLNQLKEINQYLDKIVQGTHNDKIKKSLKSPLCQLEEKNAKNLLLISQRTQTMKKIKEKCNSQLHVGISGDDDENSRIIIDALDYIKWSKQLLVDAQEFLPTKNRVAQKQDCFYTLWYKIASLIHFCSKRGGENKVNLMSEQDDKMYQEQCEILKLEIRKAHSLKKQSTNQQTKKLGTQQSNYEKLYHSQLLQITDFKQRQSRMEKIDAQNKKQQEKFKKDLSQLEQKVSDLRKVESSLKEEKMDAQASQRQHIELLKRELSDLKSEKENLQNKIKELIQEINAHKQSNSKVEGQFQLYKKSSEAKNQEIKENSTYLSRQNSKLQLEIAELQDNVFILKEKLQQKNNSIASEIKSPYLCGGFIFSCFSSKNQYPPLFENNFQINESLKKKVLDRIEDLCEKSVLETQLVYKFPEFKKTDLNLHTFIDQIHNLLIVIKLQKSGEIIGAFTQAPYQKKQVPNEEKQGILFNLNRDKFFYRRKENKLSKVAVYNQYYIVCGNSELRIKNGQKTVYSNMGIPNRFFETGAQRLEDFWGSSSNQLEIASYQVHRILFKP